MTVCSTTAAHCHEAGTDNDCRANRIVTGSNGKQARSAGSRHGAGIETGQIRYKYSGDGCWLCRR